MKTNIFAYKNIVINLEQVQTIVKIKDYYKVCMTLGMFHVPLEYNIDKVFIDYMKSKNDAIGVKPAGMPAPPSRR